MELSKIWPRPGHIVAAAIAICLIATPALSATSTVAAPRAGETISVLAKRTAFSLPDVPVIGGTFIASGTLHDLTTDQQVGEAFSQCGITKIELGTTITSLCSTAMRLKDGDLFLSSIRQYANQQFDNATFAVTGGTGKYKNSQGEGTSVVQPGVDPLQKQYKWVINLSP